jgi:hypothetical protein
MIETKCGGERAHELARGVGRSMRRMIARDDAPRVAGEWND